MTHTAETKIERAKQAFERRFGKSMLPLRVVRRASGVITIFDDETGTWASYDISAWRIRRIGEHDHAAA